MGVNYKIKTLEELEELSLQIMEQLKERRTVTFKGDLGAGKTSLIKFLSKNLGTKDLVSSPTFSIVNEYRGEEDTIYHFDLYRIEEIHELEEIGFFEYLESNAYIFIEWPEIAEDYIDGPYLEINISLLENNTRNILLLEVD